MIYKIEALRHIDRQTTNDDLLGHQYLIYLTVTNICQGYRFDIAFFLFNSYVLEIEIIGTVKLNLYFFLQHPYLKNSNLLN